MLNVLVVLSIAAVASAEVEPAWLDDLPQVEDKSVVTQVNPAYRYAQNGTHLFLSVRYCKTLQGSGSSFVQNAQVVLTERALTFAAYGTDRRNRRIRYFLRIEFFDLVIKHSLHYSMQSNGKMNVMIRKQELRKWPRIYADKRLEEHVNNKEVWVGVQKQLDRAIYHLPYAEQSRLTCEVHAQNTKLKMKLLYCSTSDSCKEEHCLSCDNFTKADHKAFACVKDERRVHVQSKTPSDGEL
eukprot:gnl/TRDRNA2_/TRDRNA2_190593_c0_seq1.p1 gnl/TRDRNA2_/TRDRNA2_190593_c0~~gnl/TRDRNA2_/TRDRNA2_190593_c0_seq1.p1  ORF type:complete len:269 (-),score=36.91 gnl/TRDRNA2_/TRDRNA2_190593_c0_seq1:51-770(-)